MEGLILGITKAIATFSAYSACYAAYFLIKRRELQVVVVALTSCAHPLAVLDIVGTSSCAFGFFKIAKAFYLHEIARKPFLIWQQAAEDQARREGHKFYNFIEQVFYGGKVRCPGPASTNARIKEIMLATEEQYMATAAKSHMREFAIKSNMEWRPGKRFLGLGVLSSTIGVVCKNQFPNLFWLDRKMEAFSQWAAPHIV